MSIQDQKSARICDAKLPSTKKQLQTFLCIPGYFRQFCPIYSSIAMHLTGLNDLTKSILLQKIAWNSQAIASFVELKFKLVDSPVLKLPPVEKDFVHRCVGFTVLLQEGDWILLPVSYARKKLPQRQQKCSFIKRELNRMGRRSLQIVFVWSSFCVIIGSLGFDVSGFCNSYNRS